jgi:glutamate/tyrosine decarboxylase-like PLP-dependent enzyme
MAASSRKVSAWFLGPKAENADWERRLLLHILEDYYYWRRNYFPSDDILIPESLQRAEAGFHDRLAQQVEEMLAGLRAHFPFYSPRYNAHMISDQTIPGVLGYFAGLLYNPNNVTPESSPVTLEWEMEVGADILRMLGYTPPPASGKKSREEFGWAHITSGGTVANLEALWVARNVRYFPLAVRDVCKRHGVPLALKVAAELRPIESVSEEQCLGIRPNQAIYLYSRFIDAVERHWHLARSEAVHTAHTLLTQNRFSVAHAGTAAAFGVRPPKLLVSGARHYSIIKAADLLGIGRENIVLVDVDGRFRMDARDLADKLRRVIEEGCLPLAVIAIAGTTEEGAVDPIDRIAALREETEETLGESFWLHVDAAWGGYLRTLFTGDEAGSVRDFVSRDLILSRGHYEKRLRIEWGSPEVHGAFAAFRLAESIVVDPHKLGYIPYPCGVAAYRNDLIRQFVTSEIPYLSTVHFEDMDPRTHRAPDAVGPYILEGSKPGAAVAACWLSHRMIPPDRSGYGEILRASLLGARELYERLVHWDTAARANGQTLPYRFVAITPQPPDTNIVCFFVQERPPASLMRTNALNRRLYESFTLAGRGTARAYSYSQAFFVSRTVFESQSYSSTALAALLDRAELDPAEYRQQGLFVLRATVMSPYHVLAAESGGRQSLLAELIECLHVKILEALRVEPVAEPT